MNLSQKILMVFTIAISNQAYGDQCKVRDPDIQGYYSGGCQDGYASGEGLAIGRDRYEGLFDNGDPHGFGIYSWGPSSQWAGDVYEGNWVRGDRTGYGVYSSSTPTYEHEEKVDERYVAKGIFENSKMTHRCTSKTECVPVENRPDKKREPPPKSYWTAHSKDDHFSDQTYRFIITESQSRLGRALMVACNGDVVLFAYAHQFDPLTTTNDRAELLVRIDQNQTHRFYYSELDSNGTTTSEKIDQESKIIAEMKAGLKIAVRSSTNDLELSYKDSVEDVFSLIGFTAAFNKLSCNQ